jgi:hypothetical protein
MQYGEMPVIHAQLMVLIRIANSSRSEAGFVSIAQNTKKVIVPCIKRHIVV